MSPTPTKQESNHPPDDPSRTASILLVLTSLGVGSSVSGRFAKLGERSMQAIRGTNPGNALIAGDVCGSQNITPDTGQQTAYACSSTNGGTQYPAGDCIDCGTQSQLDAKNAGNYVKDNSKPNIACSSNLKKTGTCWRTTVDGAQIYSCQNPQPDNNLTTCNGTVAPTIKQAAPVNPS